MTNSTYTPLKLSLAKILIPSGGIYPCSFSILCSWGGAGGSPRITVTILGHGCLRSGHIFVYGWSWVSSPVLLHHHVLLGSSMWHRPAAVLAKTRKRQENTYNYQHKSQSTSAIVHHHPHVKIDVNLSTTRPLQAPAAAAVVDSKKSHRNNSKQKSS